MKELLLAVPKFPLSRPSGTTPPSEYAKLREKCPLSQVKLWDDSTMWMVVRHKDVCDVLDDKRFSKVKDSFLVLPTYFVT